MPPLSKDKRLPAATATIRQLCVSSHLNICVCIYMEREGIVQIMILVGNNTINDVGGLLVA
jgi:hypothetical protein